MIYLRGFEKIILDGASFSIVLLLIIYFFFNKNFYNKKKNFFLLICLLFFSIQPFFFNSVLFDATKMWDQFKYITPLGEIWNYKIDTHEPISFSSDQNFSFKFSKVILANFLYKILFFFPHGSVNSIAFINKFLFLSVLFFLFVNKKIDYFCFVIILFIPSVILYSSVSLKEILLVFFSILCIYSFLEKKYYSLLLFAVLLFYLRSQYAIIFFLFLIIIKLIQEKRINEKNLKFFILILLFLFFFFSEEIFKLITDYKSIYILENNSYNKIYNIDKFYIDNFFDLFKSLINDLIIKILLLKNISIAYKFFFLLENLVLVFFIFRAFINSNYDLKLNIFFLFFLIGNYISIYYMIDNIFTAHRYFFPFLISYIIITNYKKKK